MKFVNCLILVMITFEFSYGMSSFTKASVNFSLNFFRKAYKMDPRKNSVFSPIAIQRMFTMLHHVARDDVSKQMETLLGLPKNHSLQNDLNNRALDMFTKVFLSEMEINPDLLPVLQAEYDVDVVPLDFNYPHDIVHTVNNWTALATMRYVKSLLSTQDLADDANLIMINTITLYASWQTQRSPKWRYFKYKDGARRVPMIRITRDYRFAEINDLQVLELAYEKDTDLSMLIIQSKSHSLANIIKNFNLKTYRLIDKRLSNSSLKWEIPKFTITTVLDAKRVLDALGLSSVFSQDAFEVFADFTSRLAKIFHVVSFGIDESGTSGPYSIRHRLDEFIVPIRTPLPALSCNAVDGRFMFLIRKNSSKDIIFIGHFSPEKSM